MALPIAKIFLLCFLVSYRQCSSFNLTEELNSRLVVLDIIKPNDISIPCYKQLNKLGENLQETEAELWALEMLDASSKVQSGIMSLNTGELGNFEQCIRTKVPFSGSGQIVGKYCLGQLSLKPLEIEERFNGSNQRIREQVLVQVKTSAINNVAVLENKTVVVGPTWAGCFPGGCTTADVNKIANKFIRTVVDTTATIVFDDEYCQTEKDVKWNLTSGAVIAIVVLLFYFLLLYVCTRCDTVEELHKIAFYRYLVAFSLYSNTKKIFRITKDPGYLPCLDGLKVLSILWVVLAHQYSIACSGPIANTTGLIQWADSLRSMFIVSSTMSVDTFLVISAFLLTIRFLKEKSQNISTPFYRLWLQRYIRLAPALALMVLVSSTLLTHLGSGPRWPSVKLYFQDNCESYWWSSLIFIQNYLNGQNMCIAQSWYLSIDGQLFFFSPLLLFCLYKWNTITSFVVAFCGCVCIGLSFHAAWANELSAVLSNPYGDVASYNNSYYLLTHTRAAPWFMGVLCGNLVFLYDKGKFSETVVVFIKTWAPVFWLACLAVLFGCMFGGHRDLRQPTYDVWRNAFHIALVRPVWALAICWVIFACLTDTGGFSKIVNNMLGYSRFQILRRFVYSLYLVHVPTMYLISFARKTPVYFSDFEMIHLFCGSLIVSWILAFVLVVTFESPFINLEKAFREERVHQEPTADEEPPVTSPSTQSTSTNPTESIVEPVPLRRGGTSIRETKL